MTTSDPKPEWRLTGRHVLAITVSFFTVIAAVNGLMIYYAVGTFPGAVTASSYQANQLYNTEIAAAARQAGRGWTVQEAVTRAPDGDVRVELSLRDRDGRPVTGLDIAATLEHPVNRALDRHVDLAPRVGAEGVYSGTLPGIAAGQWEADISAVRGDEQLYRSRNRVVLR